MVTTGIGDERLKLVPHFPIAVLREILGRTDRATHEEIELFDEFVTRGLPPLVNPKILAYILGISPKLIYAMAHLPNKYYRNFSIPKRSGGKRTISSPRVFLKVVQKWILINILYKRPVQDFVTGFVPGKGTLDNAAFHVGKDHVVRMDIEDFFPSVRYASVKQVFQAFGFKPDVVSVLSRLTVLDGKLPQGAPTSPCLANLVFSTADEAIQNLALGKNVTYSRYADDLTFSSNAPFDAEFLASVEKVVEDSGFKMNRAKFVRVGRGQRHATTGFVVNEKLHPSRGFRKRLRAKFHRASQDPASFQKERHRMQGWAAYVNMYDKILGREYLLIAQKIPRSEVKA
jgi:RNA-directed DNA polymerase